MRVLIAFALFAAAVPVQASTAKAIERGNRDALSACLKAAELRDAASFGKPLMFSDRTRQTALLITGRSRARHMKGAKMKMVCLYDRRSHKAEVQEAEGWTAR